MSAVESAVEQRVLNALGAAEPAQATNSARSERQEPAANPDAPDVERSGTEAEMEDRVLNALGRELAPKDAPKQAPETAQTRAEAPQSKAQPDEEFYTHAEFQGALHLRDSARQFQAEVQQFMAANAQVEAWPDGPAKTEWRMRLHGAKAQLREKQTALENLRRSIDKPLIERKLSRGRQYLQEALPDLDPGVLRAHMRELGFTDAQIDHPGMDARALVTIEMARRYKEMMRNEQTSTSAPARDVQRTASPNASRLSQNQQVEQRIGAQFSKGRGAVVGQRTADASYRQQMAQAKTSTQREKIIEKRLTKSFG